MEYLQGKKEGKEKSPHHPRIHEELSEV